MAANSSSSAPLGSRDSRSIATISSASRSCSLAICQSSAAIFCGVKPRLC
jgi:hypothetical protein